VLHDQIKNERVCVETLGEWEIWAADRRSATYATRYNASDTPIQLLFGREKELRISVVTPCAATMGWFEMRSPLGLERKCCVGCLNKILDARYRIRMPRPTEWIVYMLVESASYIHGPAPLERAAR
jgi:hypothetical protein